MTDDSTELKSCHKQKLEHMLGADPRYKKKQWGFRNHYCAGPQDTDLEEMVELGLVKRIEYNSEMIGKDSKMYHATKKGALAIGFKIYQLKNAHLI